MIISGVFCFGVYAFATMPKYSPGETMDPACSPTDPDCTVISPITSYTETDPAFTVSVAQGILSSDIINWNTAYGNASQALGVGSSPTFAGLGLGSGSLTTTGTIGAGAITGTSFSIGSNAISSFANLSSLAGLSTTSGLVKQISANTFGIDITPYENQNNKNRANGYASLDANGYIISDTLKTLSVDYFSAVLGNELLVGGGFESWTDSTHPTSWSTGYVNTGELSQGEGYTGSYSVKFTSAHINGYTPYINASSATTVSPGATYTLSFWTKGDGTYAGTYGIYDVTHSAYISGFSYTTSTGVTGNTWTKVSRDVVIPSGCTQVRVQVGGNMSVAGAVTYFDDVSFKPQAISNLNGVSSPLQTILSNFPAAAVNASLPVTYTAPLIYGNEMYSNSTFESWSGTYPNNWIGQQLNGATITKENTIVKYGFNAVKMTASSSPVNSYDALLTQTKTVVPGTLYELSFWTRGDGTNAGKYVIFDLTHSSYIASYVTTGVAGTTYTKVTVQFTAPAGCVQVWAGFTAPGVANAYAYFDDPSWKSVGSQSITAGTLTSLQNILNNFPAVAVNYDGTVSGSTATNIQDAIDEVYLSSGGSVTLNYDYYPAAYGSEIFLNPGFETLGANPPLFESWNAGAGTGTVTNETSIVHSGSHAVKLTFGTFGDPEYNPQMAQTRTVTPNTLYELTFWTRGDGTNAGRYRIYDATHSAYIQGTITTGVTGTTYTKVTKRFTAPAGCTSIWIMFNAPQATGAVAYFDDVSWKALTFPNLNGISTPINTVINNLPAAALSFDNTSNGMASTNVQDAIYEAYMHSPVVSLTPRVILPPEIAAVVGDELQVFTRGVIEAQDPYALPYNHVSSVGSTFPRYFDYTPVIGDVGTKSLSISVYDLNKTQVSTASTNLVVVNATGQPSTNKNVLCIGDSLTGGGAWPQEAYRRLTQSGGTPAGKSYGNIKFLGDVPLSGYSTQGYVAWGGWTYGLHMGTSSTTSGYILTGSFDKTRADVNAIYAYGSSTYRIMTTDGRLQVMLYSGSDVLPASGTLTHVSGGTNTSNIVYTSRVAMPGGSVFWDTSTNSVNFQSWLTRLGGTGNIDVAYILLGWNELGTGPLATDHTAAITSAKALIDKLHADYPSCQVRLLGLQVPSYNGGLGTNYGANGGITDYYNELRNTNGYNLAMASIAADPSYSSFVRYLGIASQFDTEYNMPHSSVPVNTRNSTTEDRQTNGVHPAQEGYYQIADVVYRDFIRTFCSQ